MIIIDLQNFDVGLGQIFSLFVTYFIITFPSYSIYTHAHHDVPNAAGTTKILLYYILPKHFFFLTRFHIGFKRCVFLLVSEYYNRYGRRTQHHITICVVEFCWIITCCISRSNTRGAVKYITAHGGYGL